MATINNHHLAKQINGPLSSGAAVAPNDSADLQYETRGIYVGTGGDLKVTLAQDGSTVTFAGLSGGVIHAIAASRLWATSTTAQNILALF